MQKVDLCVRGTIVMGEDTILEGYVAIRDGKIVSIGKGSSAPEAAETIEAGDHLILPGFIDAHVHSFGTPNEGITNSTRAAAAGGVTTIVDHPLDLPSAPVTVEELEAKKKRCLEEAVVDFAFLGAVTPTSIDQVQHTAKTGLVGYKLLMSDTAPNRMKRVNDGQLLDAYYELAKYGMIGGLHAENDDILKHFENKFKEAGLVHPRAHADAHPPVSETEAVMSAIAFGKAAGAHVHFFHLSLPESVEIVEREKVNYPHISCETCPHYLVLSVDMMAEMGARSKINPPLRERSDCEGLWKQLSENKLDLITSDHAPHPISTKMDNENIFKNSSGAPGVETIVHLVYSEGVVAGRITLAQMIKYLSANPAKLFGLYPQKGSLLPGADADLVLFDPHQEWTLGVDTLHYVAGWTPYEGMRVKGKVAKTILRGKVIYDQGEILAKPGYGNYLARK
jgi:allantoinase